MKENAASGFAVLKWVPDPVPGTIGYAAFSGLTRPPLLLKRVNRVRRLGCNKSFKEK